MTPSTLVIRALEEEDLELVHQWNNSHTLMTYWFEEPYESFSELVELYHKHLHDQTERRFIIELRTSEDQQACIGLVELTEIDYIHRNAEYSVLIDPAHQGQGYGLQATRCALQHAFQALNLHKVYLLVDQRNQAAIHLYEKVGFQTEGKLVDEVFTDGQYQTLMRMGLLRQQYDQQGQSDE